MRVPLILDTSAIVGYATGSNHVGETLSELSDEPTGTCFGVPIVCLINARRILGLPHLIQKLDVLAAHRRSQLLPVPMEEWRFLGAIAWELDRSDLASAFVEADRHGALLMTSEPDSYAKIDVEGMLLPFDDEDDF